MIKQAFGVPVTKSGTQKGTKPGARLGTMLGTFAGTALFSCLAFAQVVPVANIPPLPVAKGVSTPLLAAWTQFGGQPNGETKSTRITQLRFITLSAAQDCVDILARDPANPSNTIAGSYRAFMGGKNPPQQTDFNANICTINLPEDWAQVELVSTTKRQGGGSRLQVYPTYQDAVFKGPAAKSANAELTGIVMADTGCRGEDITQPSRLQQNCDHENWPFEPMIKAAAAQQPDFVVHAGDYHYFYEMQHAFWAQNHGQDRIEYWLQEFLIPAHELLMQAPWILARGNHEKCDHNRWFGEGWYKLFSNVALTKPTYSHSELVDNGTPCPVTYDQSVKQHPTAPTWAVDFTSSNSSGAAPWRFVVVDSNDPANSKQGFVEAASLTKNIQNRNAIWISHYPAVKMVYYSSWPDFGDRHATRDYAHAMKQCDQTAEYDCRPRVIFSGHQHFYQDVQWTDPKVAAQLPRVVIAGHGGTGIDKNGFENHSNRPYSATPFVCKQTIPRHHIPRFGMEQEALLTTASQFGYLLIKRNPNAANNQGWDILPQWHGPPPKFPTVSTKQCDGTSLQ